MAKETLYEYKTIRAKGAIHHLIKMNDGDNWKHHSWEGPAIIPENKESEFTRSWYFNGIPYDEESWLEIKREREGLPFYKQAAFKGDMRF